ncbi:glutaredoxin family protein [Cellvibrio zantedeschiae]|uniref:Glutaredoxin family protein n=1 Tax=Cellvibrio zantedeschiae TaxID=1237077 RepID=A0ABQ3B3V4_9GAMM|nr:glutaredoxin family protein [Cellvibrio zantedeschiae]GGY72596.1 glutaredoxin family protein [Cellvibrio zantedeschiae]
MAAVNVYLYSTVGCHLCEQAKTILWPVLQQYQFRLSEIDIAEDDKLIEQYGTRIPVLRVANYSNELNWPFTAEQVDAFFAGLVAV